MTEKDKISIRVKALELTVAYVGSSATELVSDDEVLNIATKFEDYLLGLDKN